MNNWGYMDPEVSASLALVEEVDPYDLAAHRQSQRRLWSEQRHDTESSIEHGYLYSDESDDSAPPVTVRTYWNTAAGPASPVVMWLHGGAFALGFCEIDDDLCTWLANEVGCHVIAPEYRLAPENPFPAGFDDAYSTLEWLSRNAAELNIDRNRVAVGGGSAGGALAASVCQRARDESGPPIAFQLLVYPVIDDRMTSDSMRQFVDTPIFDRPSAELMWERYLGAGWTEAPLYAAPSRADTLRGLPPAYVLTADLDPLRDEGLDYGLRLIRDGVRAELHHFPGAIHGFDTLNRTALIAQRAWNDYSAALKIAFEL